MSLNNKYQEIIKELEERITNKEEFEFVKDKIIELTMMYMDSIETISTIGNIQERQNNRIKSIENKIKTIEDDIYIDDEEDDDRMIPDKKINDNYDFEIICPYCNHDFIVDESCKNTKEIKCPNCLKYIELDWNENDDKSEEKIYYDKSENIDIPSVAEDLEEYNKSNEDNPDDSENNS